MVAPRPLDDREIDELQRLLDAVPPPLESLDVSALDGFLCGVIVQPRRIAVERWRPFVTDVDGRPLPPGFDARRLHALVARREAELRGAIERREWFDPWVFELDDRAVGARTARTARQRRGLPVGGRLRRRAGDCSRRCSATTSRRCSSRSLLLYRHLDADDLEDAETCSPRSSRSSRRPTSAPRSRSWFARPCCSPTSPASHRSR